jgi:chromosome segregation ATPase
MGGEACGLGEGTHYGCECVMRRLAEAEARAAGLESALAVAGEENAALTESRDAALRALASEQARRETAERERDEERNRAEAYHDSKNGYRERMLEHGREIDSLRSSLSAALRRAEGAEERERIAARAVADECARANRNESRAEALARALRDLTESVTAYGEKLAGPEPRGPWPIWPVAIRDALIAGARALSVGVSRTGGEPGKEGNDGR